MQAKEVRKRPGEEGMRRSIWLLGLATLLFAVLIVGALAGSLPGRGGSSVSGVQTPDASLITSDQAIAMAKEWIAGGRKLGPCGTFSAIWCAPGTTKQAARGM